MTFQKDQAAVNKKIEAKEREAVRQEREAARKERDAARQEGKAKGNVEMKLKTEKKKLKKTIVKEYFSDVKAIVNTYRKTGLEGGSDPKLLKLLVHAYSS